jgi:aspartyl-tRNA(Asn)/glutamyl-tRNA(Gln) amidotransferase subunit C
MITHQEILHLAALSSLSLSESEITALTTDLENIIAYISSLDELDTTNTLPTYQTFEMTNVWRPDEIAPQQADRAALLALTAETKDYQIKVPKVL